MKKFVFIAPAWRCENLTSAKRLMQAKVVAEKRRPKIPGRSWRGDGQSLPKWTRVPAQADCFGAYNHYIGRLNTGTMLIRGVITRKGDTPEYVRSMQNELFEVLAGSTSRKELHRMEPKPRGVARKYMDEQEEEDVRG